MASCSKCGAVLLLDYKTCPNCGAEVVSLKQPELVEMLSFEQTLINDRGFTFRIKNTGTAPLTVSRVTFDRLPTQLVGISSESGTVKDGVLTLQPGDSGEVTFRPTFDGASDLPHPAELITGSGKTFGTSVVYM